MCSGPDINKLKVIRLLSVIEKVGVVEVCVNAFKDEFMEAITAPTKETHTETDRESAKEIETSNCDDKQRAVSSAVEVAEAFKFVEISA